MKDNFYSQSELYAKFRPRYPTEFFDFVYSLLPVKENAWDVGTGNGQLAGELAKTFQHVYATDISQAQIDNAVKANNIHYSVQPAEKPNFKDNLFDLVTVGQAIHWFDFDKFYAGVNRTAKNNAVICIVGYGGVTISPEIDQLKKDFHTKIVGPFWDQERKYVDENYTTIPFPFKELPSPAFEINLKWKLEDFVGYINTWSAVKKFIAANETNPVEFLESQLKKLWGDNEAREARFPVLLRLGRVSK